MRPLEYALIASHLIMPWWRWKSAGFQLAQFALIGLHLFREGRRWQMVPSYFALLLPSTGWNWLRSCMALVSGALDLVFPIFRLPELKGQYSVAHIDYEWVDETRPKWSLYGNMEGHRRIFCRVWYPVARQSSRPSIELERPKHAPYLIYHEIRGALLAKRMRLPSFVLEHFKMIKSNSLINLDRNQLIPLANGKFPLILFSHGYMSTHDLSTALIEQLTSMGCIVAAVEHAYDSMFSYLPDSDEIIDFQASVPAGIEGEEFWQFRLRHLTIRTGDVRFIMNKLLETRPFQDFIDQEKIVAMGHSFGGGTALNCAHEIDSIKLAIGLDAYLAILDKSLKSNGIGKPVLLFQAGPKFFCSDQFWGESNDRDVDNIIHNTPASFVFRVEGATHYDFIDIPFYSNAGVMRLLKLTGPLSGSKMLDLMLEKSQKFLIRNGILPDSSKVEIRLDDPNYSCVSIDRHSSKLD